MVMVVINGSGIEGSKAASEGVMGASGFLTLFVSCF